MTQTAEHPARIERALALFAAQDWRALEKLAIAGEVTDADAAAVDRVLSDGESGSAWRRWAAARDTGAALHAMGAVLLNLERNDDALEVLRLAEEAGGDCDLLLGDVLARLGDWEQALPRLRRAQATKGLQWEVAAYRLAEYAVDMENRTDDGVFDMLAPAVGNVDMAVVLVADLLCRRGEIVRARELLEAHIDGNDRVPFALGSLLHEYVGDVEGARSAYLRAHELGEPMAPSALASLLANEEGRRDEAVEWLRVAADAGDAAARLELRTGKVSIWEIDDVEGPYPWLSFRYPADLIPWIIAGPVPEPTWQPLFVIGDDRPVPHAGQLARAARAELQIQLQVTKNELDLFSLAAAIPDLTNLRIADGARVTGLSALLDAGSLVDLNLQIKGDEPVDLSSLPALRRASVVGANFLSVCRHPQLEWLGLDLPRASLLPTIEAPIRTLSMTAKHAGAVLERVAHPQQLESLTLFKARDIDLDVLRRFPNLTKIELLWCNGIVNTAVLADLPKLRELEMYRCRNLDDAAVVRTVQGRLLGEGDQELIVGPFILSEYGDEEDGRFDLSTSSAGWEGIAEPFADRILGFSGYQMEKLVVSIAKQAGLWSRGIERDSEAEAIHLIFRGREAAVAVAKAAWVAFCDEDRLDAALQAARMRGKR